LAVDERGEAVARVALDALPDVENGATGGVDHHATDLSKDLAVCDRDPEGRKDYNVLGLDSTEIDAAVLGHEEGDPHSLEFRIHVRVMDDLAGQVYGTIRE